MTPEDVRSQRFTTRFLGGVSGEEVAAFLEDVAEAFDEVQQANAWLAARVNELENEPRSRGTPVETSASEPAVASRLEGLRAAALQEVEALLRDARAQAQTVIESVNERDAAMQREAEATRARLRIEAEEIVASATATAEALVHAAREEEAAIRAEIDRLTQSHLKLVDDVRKTLDACHQWLTTTELRGRARGRKEALEPAARVGNGVSADVTTA